MRHIILSAGLSCAAFVAATNHAKADCDSEIQALFKGGAWDPFVRENRRETTVLRDPGGKETPYADVLWDGPLRSINCTPNGCYMAVGSSTWQGPSFEGPWTGPGNTGVADPEEFVRGTNARLAASVSEAECPGPTELEGQTTNLYRFFSKPEPNEYGSWWGGHYSVWVDTKANRLLRIELAQGIASWAPKPSKDLQITTIVYDSDIHIEAPK